MTDSKHDNIYANSLGEVPDFVFDERVTQVFDDMISRSVPGYRTTISLIAELAGKFIQAGTNAYDLGCSTGAALFAMQQGSDVVGALYWLRYVGGYGGPVSGPS